MLPPVAVALVAAALPMLFAGNVSPASTFFNQLIAVAGAALWLLLSARQLSTGEHRLGPVMPWLLLALGLLLAAYAISDAPGGQRIIPFGTVLLGAALAAACAARTGDGDEASFAEPLLVALLAAALLSVVVGLVQVFAPALADGNLIAQPTTPGRAIGNMRQPNQLSTLLLWGCAAAVWLAVARRWAVRELVALLVLLVFAVVLTASRTGLVGVLLLSAWGAVDRRLPRNVRIALVACIVIYGAGWWLLEQWSHATGQSFFGNDQVEKTLHGDASSSRGRIWSNTLAMIAAQPWRGTGTGAYNFEWSMGVFPDRPIAFFDHSHNLELQLAVENGIPFAVAVIAALVWALWRGRAGLTSADPRRALGARTALFMLVLIGVHSQLEYPLWYTYFLLPTCLLAGWYGGHAAAEDTPGEGAVMTAAPAAAVDPARQAQQQAARAAELAAQRLEVWSGRARPGGSANTSPEPGRYARFRQASGRASLHGAAALTIGAAALLGSAWALAEFWVVAVVFEPDLAFGEPGTLDRRIAVAKRSILFGHHADYAEVTMAEHPETVLASFNRPLYHLLDTRLMMAYAKALEGAGDLPAAAHVAARLREFHNPASDEFFAPCETGSHPLPVQCSPDPRLSVAEMHSLQKR
ncbi:MAG: hypothetical protein RIQ60_1678 [Pseudomonadota bacterium]|jgi:O-antigen ligase